MAGEEFTPEVPALYDQTGQPITVGVDPSQVPDLYKKGLVGFEKMAKVPMLDPSGRPVKIDSNQFELALEQGYKFDTPDLQTKRYLFDVYGSGTETAKAAGEGVLRGLSVGLSDPLLVAAGMDPEAMRLRKEANPMAATGGEFAGIALPALFSGGGSTAVQAGTKGALSRLAAATPISLISKLGRGAEALTSGLVGTEAKTLAGRALKMGLPKMTGGALEGAIFGAGNAISEASLGETEMNAEHVLSNVGFGALMGAGFGAAVATPEIGKPYFEKALSKTKGVVGEQAKKAISILFGVKPEQLDTYIAMGGKEALEGIPENLADVVMPIRERVKKVYEDIADAKISKKESEIALRDLKKEMHDELIQKTGDARDTLKLADAEFESYKTQYLAESEEGAVKTAAEIYSGLEKIKNAAIDESSQITQGLEGRMLPLKPITNALDELIESAEFTGTEQALRAGQAVRHIKEQLIGNAKEAENLLQSAEKGKDLVEALKVKRMLQGLDKETKYSMGNLAAVDPYVNSMKKQARWEMDGVLKSEIPEYAEAMKPVAEKMSLISNMKRYATPEGALRSIKNIHGLDRKLDFEKIKHLEELTGTKFTPQIEAYMNRKGSIEISKAAKQREAAEAVLSNLRDPRMKQQVQEALERSPEMKVYLESDIKLKEAEAIKHGIGGIGADQTLTLVEQALRGTARSEIAVEKLHKLDKIIPVLDTLREAGVPVNAKTLDEFITKMSLVRDFMKTNQNGSANINLGSMFGAAVSAARAQNPIYGGVVGAIAGKINDKMGPKIAQWILDKYTTLAAMEKMGIDVARQIDSNVGAFLGVKNTAQAIKQVGLPSAVSQHDAEFSLKPKKKVSKLSANDFQKVSDELSRMVAHSDVTVEHAGNAAGLIAPFAPKISESLTSKTIQAATFLYGKMPKDPLAQYKLGKNKGWRPSDAELSKFSRYFEAVNNPMSIFEDLSKGTIGGEQIEVLKNVYPKLYSQTSEHIMDQLTELEDDLPYEKKLVLSTFFGVPLEYAMEPDFILRMQSGQAPQQEVASTQQRGEKPLNLKGSIADSRKSGTEEVVSRA